MRKILFILLVAVISFSSFAADYETVIAKAKEHSTAMQYYKDNYDYQSRMLNAQDLKNGLSFGVNVSGITVAKDSSLYPNATLTFTLPEYVDDMTIGASINTNHTEIGGTDNYNIVPSLNVSKLFTFKDYEDSQEELAKEKNRSLLDSSFDKQVLSFENALIDSVLSVMQLKVSIRSQQSSLEKLQTNYNANIVKGNIDSGSLADIDAKKTITKAKLQLESTMRSLDSAISSFENTYGFTYEDITEVPETDLNFVSDVSKSVTVRNAEIAVEVAKQKLEEKLGTKTTLSIGANASSSVQFGEDKKFSDSLLTTGATAALSYKNLSVNATFSGVVSKDDFSPSLSLSGKWNNDAKSQEVTDLEILELQNAYIKAQNDYDDAVFAYKTQSKAISEEIDTWKNDWEMQEIDDDYDLTVLANKQNLFDRGLITKTELDDAKTAVELDFAERIQLLLKAIKLKNKITTNNL